MDIFEILGGNGALKMRGEVTQEKAQMVQLVWDANVSLINVGLTAAKTFGRDIPESIGRELKTAIAQLDGTMIRYLDKSVDPTTMRTAIRHAQGRAEELGKAVRMGRKTDEQTILEPPNLSR